MPDLLCIYIYIALYVQHIFVSVIGPGEHPYQHLGKSIVRQVAENTK